MAVGQSDRVPEPKAGAQHAHKKQKNGDADTRSRTRVLPSTISNRPLNQQRQPFLPVQPSVVPNTLLIEAAGSGEGEPDAAKRTGNSDGERSREESQSGKF